MGCEGFQENVPGKTILFGSSASYDTGVSKENAATPPHQCSFWFAKLFPSSLSFLPPSPDDRVGAFLPWMWLGSTLALAEVRR